MVLSVTAGNGQQMTFCYLSDFLGKKIYAADGQLLGKVDDLIATMGDRFPEVDAFVLKKGKEKRLFPFAIDDFLRLAHAKKMETAAPAEAFHEAGANQFCVRDVLYDKQIVDVNGAKVERVNDVQFLIHGQKAFVVHVDVGFTGLYRRLGVESGVRRFVKIFGKTLKDEFISWKYVHPMPEKFASPVQVKLRQEQIKQLHPGEMADIIEELDRDERVDVVKSMNVEDAADALEETEVHVRADILREIEPEVAADILEEMEPASAADVIDNLPANEQKTIMAAMEADERAQLEYLHRAKDDTAGELMTVEFLALSQDATVRDAMALVRAKAKEIESISYVYCLDEDGRLVGVASLRILLVSEPDALLSSIMNGRVALLHPDDDWDEVADQMMKYQLAAMPVADADRRMLGIVMFKHSFDELLPYYYKLAG
jgi:CBS domain-containing protein/sporulation protein YlmC with PRC-barrel domain